MVKSTGELAIKLDYDYLKVFDMPVKKISHSPAYLEAATAYELLKMKGNLDEEETMEKYRLEDEMKDELAIEERLQTEAAIVAIRLGMEISSVLFVSTDFFRSGLMRIK